MHVVATCVLQPLYNLGTEEGLLGLVVFLVVSFVGGRYLHEALWSCFAGMQLGTCYGV